jgi:predicted phosphohydrolase
MQEMIREINLCIVYGNGETFETRCKNDEFKKYSNKLKDKNVVGYIKEYTDTQKISFFIKQSLGNPYDFFRLKEYNYYDSRTWSYKKIKKETFDLYMNYLFNKEANKLSGGRKFLLKKIEEVLR